LKCKSRPCLQRAGTALACNNYAGYYCFFSSFAGSAAEDEELAPEAGALLDVDGVLLEPLAALPPDDLSLELLELEAPPAAGALDESAGLLASIDTEPEVELEPDGAADGVLEPDAEELELAGGVAGVVEPDAEELELAGGVAGVVEPADEDEDPGVVLETARSPSLSQPVKSPAPSARDTATARVESLI